MHQLQGQGPIGFHGLSGVGHGLRPFGAGGDGAGGRGLGEGLPPPFGRAPQLAFAEPPCGHGCFDGSQGPPGIGWHQHQIGAGFQGKHGRFSGSVVPGDGLHHQGIGHDQAIKSQLLAQQAAQHRARQGGWALRIEGAEHQMGSHHGGHPFGDHGLKRG